MYTFWSFRKSFNRQRLQRKERIRKGKLSVGLRGELTNNCFYGTIKGYFQHPDRNLRTVLAMPITMGFCSNCRKMNGMNPLTFSIVVGCGATHPKIKFFGAVRTEHK